MKTSARRLFTSLAVISVVVVVAVCALRTRASYLEYYGDGPPYFGRTTNMDKWQSPVVELLVMNALGLAWVSLVVYGALRRANSR